MHLSDASLIDIVEYFDELINQIDITIESNLLNQHLNSYEQNDFNSIRDNYLDVINKIKNYNLAKPLQFKNLRECEIHVKDVFCFYIDHKLFNQFNERLKNVGVLVVTDFYISKSMINKIQ